MHWSYWAIIAVVCAVAEIFTGGFGIFWFGLSGMLAAGAAYFGLPWQAQAAIFALGGISLLLVTRPLTHRLHRSPDVKFGASALIGKSGVVIRPIGDPANPVGRITVMGEEWRAKAEPGIPIPEDAVVEVIGIEGITLIVKPEHLQVYQER